MFAQLSRQPFALFENNLGTTGQLLLLQDLQKCIRADVPSEVAPAMAAIARAQEAGLYVALAASYELGEALEPILHSHLPSGVPLLRAWIFSQTKFFAADEAEAHWQQTLAELTPQQAEAGILNLAPAWDETQHAAAAGKILDWIRAGDCYQANLTFPMTGMAYGHPLALYARLRVAQPVAYGALIHDGTEWMLSRSPELFVARQGSLLTCKPMKGTAPRSKDPVKDAANAASLLASDKDRAENLMIVDLIRNDLGRLAPAGGVRVSQLFELESYPTVHQLTSTVNTSPVTATLQETLAALFPCGSITGAPKIRAMQIIRELEGSPRGLYCGALGWLAPDGDFCLNVPIRTLLLDTAHFDRHNCRLDVGSGIVADSHPAAEYAECLNKAEFARGLDAGLQLIETLRWEPAVGYPMLDRHLARISRSAKELGFAFDASSQKAALLAFSGTLPEQVHRVRLSLDRSGKGLLEATLLSPLPAGQNIALATWALDGDDPRLRHKTTARCFYDTALRHAMLEGHFDLLFCNTRGELCEGARSNLFLEMDGKIFTPSAHCGLLPGVLRESLLASGKTREAVLTLKDLHRAQRIWMGNALRGLIEVQFVSQT